MAAASSSSAGFGLALVRIAVGAALLLEAQRLFAAGVGPWIVEATTYRISGAPPLYQRFGQEVVLRFPAFFAWLVAAGTLCGGGAMFLGALTRPASLGVIVLALNVYFAGPPQKREYALLVVVCALACFVARAGQRLGLDLWLDKKLPRALTWTS